MAPKRQTVVHRPQPTHLSGLMYAPPSLKFMA